MTIKLLGLALGFMLAKLTESLFSQVRTREDPWIVFVFSDGLWWAIILTALWGYLAGWLEQP